jgi:uncharacterized membrane protein
VVAEAVEVRPTGALNLAAIVAFALAVVALIRGNDLAATVLFGMAAAGFLATIILQRRR